MRLNAVAISPVTLGLYIAERHVCQKHQFSLSVSSSKKITLLYKKVQLLHFDFVKSWICRRIIRKLCICIRNKNPILIDVKYPWNIHTNVWRTVGRFCHRQYPLSMTTSANYCQLLLFVMTTTYNPLKIEAWMWLVSDQNSNQCNIYFITSLRSIRL